MSTGHAHPLFRALAALPLMLATAIAVSSAALAQSPAPAPAVASANASAQANRIVIQVSDNDPAKWNLALNNARNIQTELGASNVAIEMVAYGPGINMLKMDSAVGGRIDEALASGVKVVACENTMRGAKLTKPDMLDKIGYVPAGVVELMQRQQQGWAYLRP
jgi:intracellular sulfur oxidation DsrE/DsrF family protein